MNSRPGPGRAVQQGAVLIISLLILFVLTLIGVTALQTTSLEQKMATNARDANLAFQATEAALRAGEGQLADLSDLPFPSDDGSTGIWVLDKPDPNTGTTMTPWWAEEGTAWWNSDKAQTIPDPQSGKTYQQVTGLALQPRFVIEEQTFKKDGGLVVGYGAPTGVHYHRVTARAVGASDTSVVFLQSTFSRRYD